MPTLRVCAPTDETRNTNTEQERIIEPMIRFMTIESSLRLCTRLVERVPLSEIEKELGY